MVEDAVVDDQEAVMHRSGVPYRKCRVLRIEAADVLRCQSCVGQGVDGDVHVAILGRQPFEHCDIHIVVYQYDLPLCLANKALELSIRIEYLALEEDALGIIDFISVHSGE